MQPHLIIIFSVIALLFSGAVLLNYFVLGLGHS
jgi:hypothetical protein